MPETPGRKCPVSFWIISIALLLWGLGGASIYAALFIETPKEFAQTAEIEANREAYAAYIANIPAWALAIGIGAALTRLLGSICLLLRRAWAMPLYLGSLALFAVAMYRAFVVADVAGVMSGRHIGVEIVFMSLGIFAVGFTHWSKSKGILA